MPSTTPARHASVGDCMSCSNVSVLALITVHDLSQPTSVLSVISIFWPSHSLVSLHLLPVPLPLHPCNSSSLSYHARDVILITSANDVTVSAFWTLLTMFMKRWTRPGTNQLIDFTRDLHSDLWRLSLSSAFQGPDYKVDDRRTTETAHWFTAAWR